MDVPLVLRSARQATGLSQRGLAARARVSAATVAQAETGRRSVSVATLSRLLEACGHELSLRQVRRADVVDEKRVLAHLQTSLTARLRGVLASAGVQPCVLARLVGRPWRPELRLAGDAAVAMWVPGVGPRLPLLLDPVVPTTRAPLVDRCACPDVVVLPAPRHAVPEADLTVHLDRTTPLAIAPPSAVVNAVSDPEHREALAVAARLLHEHGGLDQAGRRRPAHRHPDERQEAWRLENAVRYVGGPAPDVEDSRAGRVGTVVSLPQWLQAAGLPPLRGQDRTAAQRRAAAARRAARAARSAGSGG